MQISYYTTVAKATCDSMGLVRSLTIPDQNEYVLPSEEN